MQMKWQQYRRHAADWRQKEAAKMEMELQPRKYD
jgi:hypothetical protein